MKCNSSDEEDSDNESSDEEAQSLRSRNGHNQSNGFEWFYGMRPPTREVIAYLKAMVQHLEMMREAEENEAMERIEKFYDEARTCSMSKVEIHPGTSVFIDKQTMALAIEYFDDNHDWKQLTTNLLTGIYHDTLEYMSVEETEGKIRLHYDILKAVEEVIRSRGTPDNPIQIGDDDFIKHVRKICTSRESNSYNP
ncbi:uncharacterized protein LOC107044910 [Diachasma alloeum]|uniref:uncharacterized protein LOC107044910 n=1 Tax=Diachasma alloeum TaxID=454923 RepID=UPI00073844BB|nr:uncharacterized protein LOC107044910 [Diachasma alloeum]